MNNFFKHNDKVYSENLNDSVLVGNAFSWSISMDLPIDSDGLFPTGSDVVKAKVADVYATPNSNLSIGSTIENSSGSSQVYRLTVYPNFNRFGGFTFVSLEGDGSVIITEKGGTSPVRNNLDYSNLGNVIELKTLREYDLVVTIPSGGVVTGLGFGFQSTSASADASISQANVSGLVDDLSSLESSKADTEHTHSSMDVIESNTLPNLGIQDTATQSRVNLGVNAMVGSLSTSIANLEIDTGWVEMTINSSNWQKGGGSGCWYRRKGNIVTVTINVVGTKTFSDNTIICTIPSSIAPTHRLEYGGSTNNLIFGGFIETDGTINIRRPYIGGTPTDWSTSTWVGFSFSYVL